MPESGPLHPAVTLVPSRIRASDPAPRPRQAAGFVRGGTARAEALTQA
jgi:hypothetical protein